MKRFFDLVLSFWGLIVFFPLILLGWLAASIDTGSNGFFLQHRVGMNGKLFRVIKLKTMKDASAKRSSITALNEARITKTGSYLRKYKLDELPQLLNIFIGQMSFVGPRPDVSGYADLLQGADKAVLSIRPGITGLATLYFKYEEQLLRKVDDPADFNDNVIYPLKTKINLEYINRWNLLLDLDLIFQTIFGKNFYLLPVKPFITPQECIEKLESYIC